MFSIKDYKCPENKIFLFLFIQLVSLVGSKISHAAIGFWIYSKTGSVMDFSLVLFCSFLPNVIGSFISGPIVDKTDFNKTFGLGDIVSAIIMLITAALVITGTGAIKYLYLVIFGVSAISALQWVAINAYLPKVLKDENLSKSVGWLSTATSLAGLLATSLASLLISTIGIHIIFIFDAFTYLLSAYIVFSLLPAGSKPIEPVKSSTFVSDFRAGFIYLNGQKQIFLLIILFVVFNLFAGINTNLMTPLFLERYSVKYAGYLLGIFSAGALIAGMVQTVTPKLARLRRNIPLLMLFIFIENSLIGYFSFPLTIVGLMFLLGANITLINTSTTLILQENVASDYRGRIFATARGLSWITVPISQLACGAIADMCFRLFFKGTEKNVFLGNAFLAINVTAALLFICYMYFGKKPEFGDNATAQARV